MKNKHKAIIIILILTCCGIFSVIYLASDSKEAIAVSSESGIVSSCESSQTIIEKTLEANGIQENSRYIPAKTQIDIEGVRYEIVDDELYAITQNHIDQALTVSVETTLFNDNTSQRSIVQIIQ